MPNNASDFNRCIKSDFVKIRSEINIKSRHFNIRLDNESQDLLDDYFKQVNSDDFPSNESDVIKIRGLRQSISDSEDGDSFDENIRSLLEFIMTKLPNS